MEVRPQQPVKAISPMVVTLLGIVMEDRQSQPQNASLPISLTLLGIIVFLHPATNIFEDVSMIALHPSRESYLGLPPSTSMASRLLQPENADSPILVTELGMVMVIKLLQPEKA